MIGYVLRRSIYTVLVMLGAATVMFVTVRLSGDPVALFVGDAATAEDVAKVRTAMGFDLPAWVQYKRYLEQISTGNLGTSFRYEQPVVVLLSKALIPTLILTCAATALATFIGLVMGVVSGIWRNSLVDYLSMGLAVLGQCSPVFLTAILAVLLFAVKLRWLPTSGWGSVEAAILPIVTLTLYVVGRIARMVRSAMLDVLSKDYIRTARAKGLHPVAILYRHALKNAAIPVVTISGVTFASLLGGVVVTETVFGIPGLGQLLVRAVLTRDFPLAQGAILVIAFMVTWANLLIDVTYVILDRRLAHD
ncbi:MAG: ABC transporter permease [Candidatus Rokubacteria bacterium]|nr:ABC transporter permease [Candidatus Rokubacteria bacterium]